MTAIVTGFPSKIAALQFEWAWQNTHTTRHIPVEERITKNSNATAYSNGLPLKKNRRPCVSMIDKVSNLHILLRMKSFERWPLEVRFFAEDVYKKWKTYCNKTTSVIREGIRIIEDFHATSPKFKKKAQPTQESGPPVKVPEEVKGLVSLDFSYDQLKSTLLKSMSLLQQQSEPTCAVCHSDLKVEHDLVLICPQGDCQMLAHMTCLSQHFLNNEKNAYSILPGVGNCPTCGTRLNWAALVRDLSLRIRGQTEVEELFKKPKARKTKSKTVGSVDEDDLDREAPLDRRTTLPGFVNPQHLEDEESEHDEADDSFEYRDPELASHSQDLVEILADNDDDDDDDEEALSEGDGLPSLGSPPVLRPTQGKAAKHPIPARVIQNSDWDDIEDMIK